MTINWHVMLLVCLVWGFLSEIIKVPMYRKRNGGGTLAILAAGVRMAVFVVCFCHYW